MGVVTTGIFCAINLAIRSPTGTKNARDSYLQKWACTKFPTFLHHPSVLLLLQHPPKSWVFCKPSIYYVACIFIVIIKNASVVLKTKIALVYLQWNSGYHWTLYQYPPRSNKQKAPYMTPSGTRRMNQKLLIGTIYYGQLSTRHVYELFVSISKDPSQRPSKAVSLMILHLHHSSLIAKTDLYR
jgi:hypothetical protein